MYEIASFSFCKEDNRYIYHVEVQHKKNGGSSQLSLQLAWHMAMTQAKLYQSCYVNFERDQSEQKLLLSLDTHDGVSVPSTCRTLNSLTCPLTFKCRIFPCCKQRDNTIWYILHNMIDDMKTGFFLIDPDLILNL